MMQKRNIFHLLLAGVLLTGCSAESEQSPTVGGLPINLGYSVVTATAETRAATNLNNDALTSGSVAVSVKKHTDGTYTTTYNYTAAAGGALSPTTASNQFYYETDGSSSDIIAYYPATASATFPVQADQTSDDNYKASDLMWAQLSNQMPTNSTVNLQFSHKMSKIIVNASAGTGITSITSVTLNNVKPKVDFTASDGTVTLASSDNTATSITMSNEGAAIIPPQPINGNFITIVTPEGTAVYAVDKTFATGHQYTLNITVNAAAIGTTNTITGWTSEGTVNVQPTVEKLWPGALPGKFSVAANKKVYFSQGNLRATYNGSSWTWSFAENQWDYIGNATGNTNVTDSSPFINENATVDLFGWVGASSTWTGVDQYGISSSTATHNTNGYGNNASESLKSDWGNLAISNGGGVSNSGWFTLTADEWFYLFGMTNNDSDWSGHARYRKYFRATVNSVQGIIVLPDDIGGISDIPAVSSRGTASTFGGKTYTTAAWSALESAGAVFLPAAGYRNGTTVHDAGLLGNYWSSSPFTTIMGVDRAYFVNFDSDYVNPLYDFYRYYGHSVRLVRVAP